MFLLIFYWVYKKFGIFIFTFQNELIPFIVRIIKCFQVGVLNDYQVCQLIWFSLLNYFKLAQWKTLKEIEMAPFA